MLSGPELLREWMERRGYGRQSDVAKTLGMHESFLSMLLNGHRLPSLATALVIEDQTGIPVRVWASSAVDKTPEPVGANGAKGQKSQRVKGNGR